MFREGDNYIELAFDVTKANASDPARAIVEVCLLISVKGQVMVASDDVFNSIGVDEDGVHYFCCDDQAFDVWVVGRVHLRIMSAMTTIDFGLPTRQRICML